MCDRCGADDGYEVCDTCSMQESYDNQQKYSLPEGYAEMMDRLANPDCWDVPGLIADTCERLRRESIDGEMLAVIDTLAFRMADICQMIDAEERPNYEIISKVYEVAARLTIAR